MLACECPNRRDGFFEDVLSGLWVHAACGRPTRQLLTSEQVEKER